MFAAAGSDQPREARIVGVDELLEVPMTPRANIAPVAAA